MSNIKKEIEAMAIHSIACPSCGAEKGKQCHYVGSGGGLARLRKVKTHQRRMSKFIADHMGEK